MNTQQKENKFVKLKKNEDSAEFDWWVSILSSLRDLQAVNKGREDAKTCIHISLNTLLPIHTKTSWISLHSLLKPHPYQGTLS